MINEEKIDNFKYADFLPIIRDFTMKNIGIVSYGAYIPRLRIKTEEIAKAWGKDPVSISKGLGIMEKSV